VLKSSLSRSADTNSLTVANVPVFCVFDLGAAQRLC
jgi:hypothetical protein